MTASATWKVGRLAEASGLTVRTLHHWDTIGLLSPSRRTTGGHKEYTEDDLARLHQVLALRDLGLSLDNIAVCLDAGVDPIRLVRDHLTGVEASIAALGVLRERLALLEAALASGREPGATALFDALEAIGGTGQEGEHALGRHLDADQMQTLRTRAGPSDLRCAICWRSSGRSCTAGPSGSGRPGPLPPIEECVGWPLAWTNSARCSPAATPASPPECGPHGATIRPPCRETPTLRPTTGVSWPGTWTALAAAPHDPRPPRSPMSSP
ncbi:MerR family transcriptional regulator [Streptomyces triticiradicis]|uniref:MerR family transcriptional regulator n=1 Tax=Streptomyces triticiradicis TaxID=2651189 RepID=UPI001CEDAEAE|nr:MerR family transcriptional regulator [Streptomyces triticiradicis]